MPKPLLSISFVIPCLNEELTLGTVLKKINHTCQNDLADHATEVIVSDNGSSDRSVEIAVQHGARVVHCPVRGYGAALKHGIQHARHEVIIFADADNTYDFCESPRLVGEIEKGHDLVIGSRLRGEIQPGAMPFLHHYLGTPALNLLINLLYAKEGRRISDCNSGFRCFRKDSYLKWGVRSDGMEFASEMLVKALKSGISFSEVPVSLYPDERSRIPHLKTWRDGMRHLLQILVESPGVFNTVGLAIWTTGWIMLLVGLFFGPLEVLGAWLFGLHTMMFALLGTLFGLAIWSTGLFLASRPQTDVRLYAFLIRQSEDRVFWFLVGLFLVSALLFGVIITMWGLNGFQNLYLQKETLSLVAFAANGLLILSSVFTAHLLKRL